MGKHETPKETKPGRRGGKRLIIPLAVLLVLVVLLLALWLTRTPASPPQPTPTPAPTATPTPAPTPAPTPTPTPEVELCGHTFPVHTTILDLSDVTEPDLAALVNVSGSLPFVDNIDLTGCTLSLRQLEALRDAYPGAIVRCTTSVGGIACDSTVAELDFTDGSLDYTEAALACRALPYLGKLIFPPNCGYSNEELAALNDAYDTRIVWTVRFGPWSLRTDATCFSTLQTWPVPHRYEDADFLPLFTYCTDLVALDLGHNDLIDLTPMENLTKLKVLILADNRNLLDISALAHMPDLEYLELFNVYTLTDFSALYSLTEIVDLNLSYCPYLKDLGFLDNMPRLEKCWLRSIGVPYRDRAGIEDAHPEVEFLWDAAGEASSTMGGWRKTERNIAIRTAFSNWRNVENFAAWDDVTYKSGAEIVYAIPLEK